MNCPRCGDALSTADGDCTACSDLSPEIASQQAVKLSTPVVVAAAALHPVLEAQSSTNDSAYARKNDDKPSFFMAFIGFVIPLVGLIIFLADRSSRPLQARSAGRGALASCAFSIAAIALGMMWLSSPYANDWRNQRSWTSPSRIATTIAPTNQPEPVLVNSKIEFAYNQIQTKAGKMVEAGKFDELEKQAAQYRKTHDKFLSGFWKIAAMYQGMSEVSDSASDIEWEKRRQILANWVARSPRSITAHVALVRCYHDGAYRARGSDWASKVKPEQWKLMGERLDKAAGVLAASASMQNQCPGWFAAAQRTLFLKGRSQKEFDAITDEALRLFPDYNDFHFMRAKFRMARWYGKDGDWQAYAKRVADAASLAKNQNGDALYAKIVWYMQSFADSSNARDLDGIDWKRAKRGFDIMLKEPDSFAAASPCARVAWLVGDREKAKALFQSPLQNHMDDAVWSNKAEFQTARQWALQ